MNRYFNFIILGSLSFLMSACSLSPIKTQPISYYQLDTDYSATPNYRAKQTRYTLFVARPAANSGYERRAMVYIVKPYQLKTYSYNQWVDSPANMTLNVLTDHLQRSGYFHAVTSPPTSSLSNFQLNTQVIVFQQEFLQSESQFHIVIQATLINNHTQKVVATRRFESITAAPENNPYSGVIAANEAINKISHSIVRFCLQYIR